jgi:hypothetical protein
MATALEDLLAPARTALGHRLESSAGSGFGLAVNGDGGDRGYGGGGGDYGGATTLGVGFDERAQLPRRVSWNDAVNVREIPPRGGSDLS